MTTASIQHAATLTEPLRTVSNGLPPPDEFSPVGSGAVVDVEDSLAAAEEDWTRVGACTFEVAVDDDGGLEVDDLSNSSVVVAAAVAVVDVGRMMVNESRLDVRVVEEVAGAATVVLVEVEGGLPVSVPSQTKFTKLPARTCPSTDSGGTLTALHALMIVCWTWRRPLTQVTEHLLPGTKSFKVQPKMAVL